MLIRYLLCFLLLYLSFSSSGAFAQINLKLSGTVINAKSRQPLESVTILKIKTRRGTITNAAGKFQLMVNPNDTLIIRSVGYKLQQYVVQPSATDDFNLVIRLEEGFQELPEVSIVGGLDYEKVNKALRNMKKPPEPKVAVKTPAPQPLYPEFKGIPISPDIMSPISLLYDLFSTEGKDKRKLAEILAEDAARRKALADKKKQQAYDSLFLDRNKGFRTLPQN